MHLVESCEFLNSSYEIDIIFDGDQELQMKTISNNNLLDIIQDVESFMQKHKSGKPKVLCARFFIDDQIVDIKQKITETLKARRKIGQ